MTKKTTEESEDIIKCSMCDKPATGEYEGIPSCSSVKCEITIQQGLDYIEERRG